MKKTLLLLLTLICSVMTWADDIVWKWTADDAISAMVQNQSYDYKSTDGNYTLTFVAGSTSDKVNSSSATIDGVSYTHQLYMNGATSTTRTLSFTGISGNGYLTIVTGNQTTWNGESTIKLNTAVGGANATNVATIFEGIAAPNTSYKSDLIQNLDAKTTYYILFGKKTYVRSIIWTPASTSSEKYAITIADNIEHGSVSADVTEAVAGAKVSLTATPASGYKLFAWDVKDASSNAITVTNNKFTMPASTVTVGATFVEASAAKLPLSFSGYQETSDWIFNADWSSTSFTSPTAYYKLYSGNSISSPEMTFGSNTFVRFTVNMRTVGGASGNSALLDIYFNTTLIGTIKAENNSLADYILDITGTNIPSGDGVLSFKSETTDDTHGLGVHSISIEAITEPVLECPSSLTLDYNTTDGEIAYSITNPDASTLTASVNPEATWVSNVNVDEVNNKVTFNAEENNTSDKRTATITLTYGTIQKDVAVTQNRQILDYVILPFNVAAGMSSADLKQKDGVKGVFDGNDYNNETHKVKFSKNTHYLQIKTNERIGECTFSFCGLAAAGSSSFKLQESVDGTEWIDVESFTVTFAAKNDVVTWTSTKSFSADARYLKLAFLKNTNEVNCGLGEFSVDKYVPTFASLDDLIAAEQSFDAVNVTINDEIFTTMADSEDNAYAVVFKNKSALTSFGGDLGWKAGGKVTGTLSNVKWTYDGPGEIVGYLICPSTVWDALEYTAPKEIPTFNSVEKLLGANLPSGTAVNVTIKGTIKEAKYNDGGGKNYYAVQLEGDFVLGAMFVPDYGWKRGGTISGTLENVTYYDEVDEKTGERERGVIGTAGDIFAGLTYLAPVTTYTEDVLTFVANDGKNYWATFSSDKDVFVEEDAMPYAVTVAGSTMTLNDGAFVADDIEIENTPVSGYWIPANTGVLLQSSTDEVFYWTVDYADVAAITADNMLRPASVAKEAEGFKFYKLAYASSAKDGLGFYWGAAEGAAFTSREGSAYLAVPAEVAGSAKSGFKFDDDTATGINNVKAEAATGVAYNLAGQRVNATVKGIVIMNGKKFINK